MRLKKIYVHYKNIFPSLYIFFYQNKIALEDIKKS